MSPQKQQFSDNMENVLLKCSHLDLAAKWALLVWHLCARLYITFLSECIQEWRGAWNVFVDKTLHSRIRIHIKNIGSHFSKFTLYRCVFPYELALFIFGCSEIQLFFRVFHQTKRTEKDEKRSKNIDEDQRKSENQNRKMPVIIWKSESNTSSKMYTVQRSM